MKTCTLCDQKFVGEIELELHLALVHDLGGQASSSACNLKRKSLSNDGVGLRKVEFFEFHCYILN